MKGNYVVRYSRYDSVTSNFNNNKKRKDVSRFGEIETVFQGSKPSCISFVKTKAIEATLEAIDTLAINSNRDISLSTKDIISLDVIDSCYDKNTDVRVYRNDHYTVEEFKSWMK